MLSVSLKPFDNRQSIGDLIGRAVRLYRQNWLFIMQILIVPAAAATVGKISLQWGLNQCTDLAKIIPGSLAIILGFLLSLWFFWILILRQLALIRLFGNFDQNYRESYAAIKQRRGQIFAVLSLGYVLILVTVIFWTMEIVASAILVKELHISVALGLAGIFLGFIGMLAGSVITGVFAPLTCALSACEELKITQLMKEGFSLTFAQFVRNCLFHSLLLISITALLLPLSLPMLVSLSCLEFFKHGFLSPATAQTYKLSLVGIVIIQVWESLTYMVIWPIFFLAFGMLYLDLKARLQANDITQKLRSLTPSEE